MVDRLREDLSRLVQVAAGIKHVVDLGPVLGPLFDLIEVAVVRDKLIVGLFLGLVRAHSGGVELWWQIWHVTRDLVTGKKCRGPRIFLMWRSVRCRSILMTGTP